MGLELAIMAHFQVIETKNTGETSKPLNISNFA